MEDLGIWVSAGVDPGQVSPRQRYEGMRKRFSLKHRSLESKLRLRKEILGTNRRKLKNNK